MASPVRGVSAGLGETVRCQAGPMDGDSRTARRERRTGVPLGAASLLCPASFAVRVLGRGLRGPLRDPSPAVTCAGWALFVVGYAVRRRRSPLGHRFVHRYRLDSAVVLLPRCGRSASCRSMTPCRSAGGILPGRPSRGE
ncbi:hypothetical protein AB0919_13160 [Streptomyces sp. NPDC046994]|uniref:hypothetical protein n=1 Tax=Streptomyces sp. NPDC046994 TaxID=3155735 RepID=UPI003455E386